MVALSTESVPSCNVPSLIQTLLTTGSAYTSNSNLNVSLSDIVYPAFSEGWNNLNSKSHPSSVIKFGLSGISTRILIKLGFHATDSGRVYLLSAPADV